MKKENHNNPKKIKDMGTIVLYPSPGMGHLISMVELGKFILNHHPSFTITILTVPLPVNTGSTASYIRHVSATDPSITFHHLPTIPLDLNSYPSMESIIFETLRRSNDEVRQALETIPDLCILIIDFFCTSVLPVSKELNVPTYYFITSGASVVAVALFLVTLDKNTTKSYKDMGNALLDVPGLPPIPASDMWMPILDRESTDYKEFLNWSCNMPNSDGILVNTFESLEPSSLRSIREGKCNPDTKTPQVFCVGPLLNGGSNVLEHDCLKWLDAQPEKSVIFLCFGSLGLLTANQLHELAVGLERSGHRFLWVVRSPPSGDKASRFLPPPEPDLNSLLPEGFLERTRGTGYVLKSWAPQVAVLNHTSVGGFVTHCGWNSVLEAVCAGVPMVAWPLYAEQHFNRVVLVEQMKIALSITETDEGLVTAEEVVCRMDELMDPSSTKGKEVRERVKEMSLAAKEAMSNGGSSVAALTQLAQLWKHGK